MSICKSSEISGAYPHTPSKRERKRFGRKGYRGVDEEGMEIREEGKE
jgi:hypothetical protein